MSNIAIRASLKDDVSPGLTKIKAEASGLGAHVSGAFSKVGTASNGLSTTLGHTTSKVSGLMSSVGGLIGAGGLLGFTAIIGSSIREAAEFGGNVQKVAKITNMATADASAMVDTLDKWGVSGERQIAMVGKLEKNVGTLAGTTKKADAFQKQYGFSITDSNGKIANANELLLRSADYFNSNASATDKAVVMAKLWGKSWQDMIPILSKGSDYIRAQEKDAIHLTKTQTDNIAKFRTAQREFGDAVGDMEVLIGSEVMPLLTSGLKEVTTWLGDNQDKVVGFFHDAAREAGNLADAAKGVFLGLKTGWDAIPGPVKDFLVKAFIAGKVTKFLFDVGPIDLAKMGAKLAAGFIAPAAAKLGETIAGTAASKAIPQDVVVVAFSPVAQAQLAAGGTGGGIIPTVEKIAAPVATGLAPMALGTVGALGLAGGSALSVIKAVTSGIGGAVTQALSGSQDLGNVVSHLPGPGIFPDLFGSIDRLQRLLTGQPPPDSALDIIDKATKAHPSTGTPSVNTQTGFVTGGVSPSVNAQTGFVIGGAWRSGVKAGVQDGVANVVKAVDALHVDLQTQIGILKTSKDPKEIAAAAQAMVKDILAGAGGVTSTTNMLGTLKAQRATATDPALIAILDSVIAKVGARLDTRKFVAAQEKAADKIVASNKPTAQKIKELEGIEKSLHGKSKVAIDHVAAEVDSLKPHIDAIRGLTPIQRQAAIVGSDKGTPDPSLKGPHAAGIIGFTSGMTDLGFAGEAGTEGVAVVRNPKRLTPGALGGALGGRLDVNVNLSSTTGIITPGAARAIMQELGPLMTIWLQRNGILPRTGTPIRG